MKVKCKCTYCNKDIVVNIPKEDLNNNDIDATLGNSCNDCVAANSASRDGINESIYTEVKKKENWNDKLSKWLKAY
jgi:hypothetical protein